MKKYTKKHTVTRYATLAALMLSALLVMTACFGKGKDGDPSTDTQQGSSKTGITQTGERVGSVAFTVIDDDTILASVSDPYILALATEESQLQLKLYTDESAVDRNEGNCAFKMSFGPDGEGGINCNVYPQICKSEKQEDGAILISDEEIADENGVPAVGTSAVEETLITFVAQGEGLGALVRQAGYYAVYVDYEEWTRGKLTAPQEATYVTPDISQTSLQGQVDLAFFDKVSPNYVVMEQDFAPYMSYDNHAICPGVGAYEGQIFWTATGNSENSKKALIVASVDGFGVSECYVAIVYETHRDLMRDYVGNGEVNLTQEYGLTDPDSVEMKDEMIMDFLPQDTETEDGNYTFAMEDNVFYIHYTPNFETHYRSLDGFSLPHLASAYADTPRSSLYIEDALNQVLRDGEIDTAYDYEYYWDDMTQSASNNMDGKTTITYKGRYIKGATVAGGDEEKILQEVQRIRNEMGIQAQAQYQEQTSAPQTVDPMANCMIYDEVSTDIGFMNLDMDLLANGGAYEVDFSGYTIRVTAASADNPKTEIGRYNGDTFEAIEDQTCYRDLDTAPNCIRVNAYLGNIADLTWRQVNEFTLYEVSPSGERRKIAKEVNIASYL